MNEELAYCIELLSSHGDDNVGHDPKSIAAYLRLQASAAFRSGDYEVAARFGAAATAVNWDARNNHAPDWRAAIVALTLN
jgi:hypothetical protein